MSPSVKGARAASVGQGATLRTWCRGRLAGGGPLCPLRWGRGGDTEGLRDRVRDPGLGPSLAFNPARQGKPLNAPEEPDPEATVLVRHLPPLQGGFSSAGKMGTDNYRLHESRQEMEFKVPWGGEKGET